MAPDGFSKEVGEHTDGTYLLEDKNGSHHELKKS